jgi:hypothetical protein
MLQLGPFSCVKLILHRFASPPFIETGNRISVPLFMTLPYQALAAATIPASSDFSCKRRFTNFPKTTLFRKSPILQMEMLVML